MKKLSKDACLKTAFSFNDNICKEIDGVSMESSFGPLLANFFITEVEKQMLRNPTLKELNNYNKNIKFTVDRFINEDVNFLHITFHQNNTDIYYKDTHAGWYIHYHSQTPLKLKTS